MMLRLLLIFIIMMFPAVNLAAESYHIGFFTSRPAEILSARWSALEDYLESEIPDSQFKLQILNSSGLEQGINENRFDFLIIDPGHYIQLRTRFPLSGALGTLVRSVDGQPVSAVGGVMLTLASNQDIHTLADLRGKTVASVGTGFLGGYLAQMTELMRVGIKAADLRLKMVSGSYDDVVQSLLSGESQVAFVRTGILEQMSDEGLIDANKLRVINPQELNDYPFVVSTGLYPEWPFIALPRADPGMARKLASALLSIEPDSELAIQIGIQGFDIPDNYQIVEQNMRKLALPPFDKPDVVTFSALWQTYRPQIFLALSALAVILLQTLQSLNKNRSLKKTEQESQKLLNQLRDNHKFLRTVFSAIPDLVWIKDAQGVYLDCNKRFENFVGRNREATLGQTDYDFFDRELADFFRGNDLKALTKGESISNEEEVTFASDGHKETLETTKTPIYDTQDQVVGVIGIGRDISARKYMEEKLRLYQKVYVQTHEGIMVLDSNGVIVDVNPAFTEITGYSDTQAIGSKPEMLNVQDHDFYHDLWQELVEKGRWKGELWNRKRNGELYAELISISALNNADGEPQYYVGIFSDITQNKNQQEELNNLAHYDALTGLANRVLFSDRYVQAVAHAHRNNKRVAICYIDLDNFKPVNDQHGHEAGDLVLVEVADRLVDTLRAEDIASRQGGDEFSILLTNVESKDDCRNTIERILQSLSSPFQVEDTNHIIGASIGVAISSNEEDSFDTLLRQADHAMYQAKLSGKNQYRFYDRSKDVEFLQRMSLQNEIKRGLDKGEFLLVYQPKVDMVKRQVFGAEALIRWQHPEQGLIPPLRYLRVLEQTQFECHIGEWVIHEALTQMARWLRQGLSLHLSINISSHHLQQRCFIDYLQQQLALFPSVDPELLELEILESSVLGDIKNIARVIKECQRKLRVKFALDDFGTGYSSLAHLRSLSVNTIKIDQSFVRDMMDDPNDMAIVDAVIGLGRSFGQQLIAEGVETVSHGQMLQLMGCNCAQGYGIARPMPLQEFMQWLDNSPIDTSWSKYQTPMTNAQKDLRKIIVSVDYFFTALRRQIETEQKCDMYWPQTDMFNYLSEAWTCTIEHDDEAKLKLDSVQQDLYEIINYLKLLYQSDKHNEACNLLSDLDKKHTGLVDLLESMYLNAINKL